MRALPALLLLLSLPAWGATYYVRSSVNCPNNGNGSAPTCAGSTNGPGAIRNHNNTQGATFAPGDTVYICDVLPSSSSPQWNSTIESGTAGSPIVFDGNCPMGDGTYRQGGYDALGTTNYAFFIATTSPDHITWRNLIFENAANDVANINVSTATGLRFENVVLEDAPNEGFDVDDAADGGINIDGMTVRRAGVNGISCSSSNGGIWRNLRVEDSGTLEVNGDGVAINDGCGDGKVLEDVVVLRQRGGGGVDLQDSTGTGTVRLRRAWLEGGDHAGYTAVCNAGSQTIEASAVISINNGFNVYLKDCVSGLHTMSHFTTFGATTTELKLGDSGTSGDQFTAEIKNSSFGGASCAAQAVYYRNDASVSIASDNNQFCRDGVFGLVSGGELDFDGWKTATSQDANSVEADPQFLGGANPETPEGFRPLATSPLIRAGTCYLSVGCSYPDYEDRAQTTPPTIGAFSGAGVEASAPDRTTAPERTPRP